MNVWMIGMCYMLTNIHVTRYVKLESNAKNKSQKS